MQSFEWVDATSVEQAASMLAAGGAGGPIVAKAGGIDLIDFLKEGILRPSRVVNLKSIDGLDHLAFDGSGALTLGALVTLARIEAAPDIRRQFPALADAARHAATPQVRNAATIGGNLLQRPRCWYFRSAHFHRDGADPAPAARDGENQYHAIFDNARSAMVHASTPATALVAHGAEVTLTGETGQSRSVPLEDFLLPPDAARDRDTAMLPNEVLTSVRIPAPRAGTRAAYHKQTERESYDWPICDVAILLTMEADTVREASIVLGWVAPTLRRAVKSARLLRGKRVTDALAREAAKAAVVGATPLSKNPTKCRCWKPSYAARSLRLRLRSEEPDLIGPNPMRPQTDPAPAVCRQIRAKGAGVAYGEPIRWESGYYPNAVFWCLSTEEPVGPDDGVVHPHVCTKRRACYRRSESHSCPTLGTPRAF